MATALCTSMSDVSVLTKLSGNVLHQKENDACCRHPLPDAVVKVCSVFLPHLRVCIKGREESSMYLLWTCRREWKMLIFSLIECDCGIKSGVSSA